ncbi:hypothetical protein [Salipaludibacillus sp. CF4.18]|uniref:hypothetical protein n=1 Tax=Salipaludibacillus sp. CF4.18 TaxID=3373081 RepID=UPI003EE5BE83
MRQLSDQTSEELKDQYHYLIEELKCARNVSEFEKVSEIKMQMVYIIGELKNRTRNEE